MFSTREKETSLELESFPHLHAVLDPSIVVGLSKVEGLIVQVVTQIQVPVEVA